MFAANYFGCDLHVVTGGIPEEMENLVAGQSIVSKPVALWRFAERKKEKKMKEKKKKKTLSHAIYGTATQQRHIA
jgi:hypothetical protein